MKGVEFLRFVPALIIETQNKCSTHVEGEGFMALLVSSVGPDPRLIVIVLGSNSYLSLGSRKLLIKGSGVNILNDWLLEQM